MVLKTIESHDLPITVGQTTNIIFPYAILSVDRGSADVLVQKAKGASNILQLKAAHAALTQTNVTVVTTDGHFYSFRLHYDAAPAVLNVSVETPVRDGGKAKLASLPLTADTLQAVSARIKQLRGRLHAGAQDQLLHLRLCNIFADSIAMWCTLRLCNSSTVGFSPDILRCYVKEKRRAKRTAVQEKELVPLYTDSLQRIGRRTPLVFSLVFAPFTIKRSQRFYIQIGERSGARLLTLPIGYKMLLKARALP